MKIIVYWLYSEPVTIDIWQELNQDILWKIFESLKDKEYCALKPGIFPPVSLISFIALWLLLRNIQTNSHIPYHSILTVIASWNSILARRDADIYLQIIRHPCFHKCHRYSIFYITEKNCYTRWEGISPRDMYRFIYYSCKESRGGVRILGLFRRGSGSGIKGRSKYWNLN